MLLDLARSICAAPRATLQGFLVAQGHQTTWLPDTVRAILDTMRPRLDSTLADYARRGLLFDDSGLVEMLVSENRPATAVFASTQHLDRAAPFSDVGSSLVPYLSARCDKVLAAADFSAAVEVGSRRTSEAFDAALALVSSFAALY